MAAEPPNRQPWVIALVIAAAIGVAGFWFWPSQRVTLDDRGYDMTLALYRVCNQRDTAGLAKIEEQIGGLEMAGQLSDASQATLAQIISAAKEGRWQDAAMTCREAMEDQVGR